MIWILVGLILSVLDICFIANSLTANIIKRFIYITLGIVYLYFIEPIYLILTKQSLLVGVVVGIIFMAIHIIISKGIKLKLKDINSGFMLSCFIIYIIELPAEEFLYRGIILISTIHIFGLVIAIALSSLLFLLLHIKTWDDKFIIMGSLLLGLTCSISVYFTRSIWTAIIIHNLNNFGFLTLVNKRNIFV